MTRCFRARRVSRRRSDTSAFPHSFFLSGVQAALGLAPIVAMHPYDAANVESEAALSSGHFFTMVSFFFFLVLPETPLVPSNPPLPPTKHPQNIILNLKSNP